MKDILEKKIQWNPSNMIHNTKKELCSCLHDFYGKNLKFSNKTKIELRRRGVNTGFQLKNKKMKVFQP